MSIVLFEDNFRKVDYSLLFSIVDSAINFMYIFFSGRDKNHKFYREFLSFKGYFSCLIQKFACFAIQSSSTPFVGNFSQISTFRNRFHANFDGNWNVVYQFPI